MKANGKTALGIATGSNRLTHGTPPANELPTFGSIPLVITLAAAGSATGGDKVTQSVLGTSFYISAISVSAASVLILPTGGDQGTYELGTGQDFEGKAAFASLSITNPNSFAVTLTIIVGFPQFIDRRVILSTSGLTASLPVRCATTLAKGYGTAGNPPTPITLANLSGQDFPGTAITGLQRKQIIVTNLSNTAGVLIYVLDSKGLIVGVVFPSTPWTFECSDDLTVYNPNGGSVQCTVGETYYDE